MVLSVSTIHEKTPVLAVAVQLVRKSSRPTCQGCWSASELSGSLETARLHMLLHITMAVTVLRLVAELLIVCCVTSVLDTHML